MIKPGLALFQDSVMIVMSIVQLLGSTGLDPWRLKPWNPYWSYCFWVSNQGVVDDVCCLNAGGHGHHPHHPAPTRIVNLPLLLLVGTLLIFHICIVRRDLTTLEYILAGEPCGSLAGTWREPGKPGAVHIVWHRVTPLTWELPKSRNDMGIGHGMGMGQG